MLKMFERFFGRGVEKGKLIARIAINTVIAAFLYGIISNLLNNITGVGGLVLSAVISLAVLVFIVPWILELHPGKEYETLTSLVFSIPVGMTLIAAINGLFNVSLPILAISDMAIGSVSLVIAMTCFVVADLITSMIARQMI